MDVIVLILHIVLYRTIWINFLLSLNTVPYPYFPHVLSLHILYIQVRTVKYINCNTVPYPYFPHVLSLHILYIQLQTVKYIDCIINCNISPNSVTIVLTFIYIYTYKLWNNIFSQFIQHNKQTNTQTPYRPLSNNSVHILNAWCVSWISFCVENCQSLPIRQITLSVPN
jgi:hypothetical protein